MNREELIEYIEKMNGMIPPNLSILFEHGVNIKDQKTHVLRLIYEGLN